MFDLGWQYLSASDKAALMRGFEDGVAHAGPFHIEIYPSDRCNIDCFFCSTASIRGNDEIPAPRIAELISEAEAMGTRSIRLSGGGEPLFHRSIVEILERIANSSLRLEGVTTNGVLLTPRVIAPLLRGCDKITVSLNTGDATTYAEMMRTPARNFGRVLENIRALIAARDQAKKRTPEITVQFLVWKGNYRSIASMYDLATDLGVDSIVFGGLSRLTPEQMMSAEQTAEMLHAYEQVLRRDRYRRIRAVMSFEQDISGAIAQINDRLSSEKRSLTSRVASLFANGGFSLRQRFEHRLRMRRIAQATTLTEGLLKGCVIGWHSLVVKTNGEVAPCCILQHKSVGNVYKSSLRDVWFSDEYNAFRRELKELIDRGDAWQHDPESHKTVLPLCSATTGDCPIKSSYYANDAAFVRRLNGR